jgi:ATP-binding cassette subfamily B protein
MSFMMMSMFLIILPRASVSAGRIADVLETEPVIADPLKPQSFGVQRGRVEFRNVSFKYPGADEYVLRDISFTAGPGETTAFLGSTGSGKSTLINLVPRFYDATEGEILVDGVNIVNVTQRELREKIGYVPQRGVLFSGTIASNIAFGENALGEADMRKAAEIAQASAFIDERPDKYDDVIAQGGANVSGGQKQRLSIARALAKKPEIYIVDDSFSALDFKTDAALRAALASETKSSAVLIVAQRINTIRNADRIVVLDEGRVVGIGKHAELLRSCEVYRQIAESQLPKEQLAAEGGEYL